MEIWPQPINHPRISEASVAATRPTPRSPSIEVVIYFGFLLAFMGLLAVMSGVLGVIPLDIVFVGFIFVVLGAIVMMDRVIG